MTSTTLLAAKGTELLDQPDADPDLVRINLRDISRVNRWLGGRHALSVGSRRALSAVPPGTHLTLLDIGTGSGDLPAYCRAWGHRRGLTIRTLGLERVPAAAVVAAESGLATFVGCASALPIKTKSVDVVLISQVVHHFRRAAAVNLLRACDSFARRAVIMVDLERSSVAKAAFRVASSLMRFAPVTRADGLISIDRGLTRDTARALLAEAGVEGDVRSVTPYRLVATWAPHS